MAKVTKVTRNLSLSLALGLMYPLLFFLVSSHLHISVFEWDEIEVQLLCSAQKAGEKLVTHAALPFPARKTLSS